MQIISFLQERLKRLISEASDIDLMMQKAKDSNDEHAYKYAQALGEDTLAQVWAARKEIENNNNKGLYFEVSETSDYPAV